MVVKKLYSLLMLLILPFLLGAVRVHSSVNKNTLSLNDQLEYTIKISDSSRLNISEPSPPKIPLFTFRNMTSGSSTAMSIINGKLTATYEHSFRFYYFPQKPGSSAIPAQTVKVSNRSYQTQAHQLTVVKGAPAKPAQPAPAFPTPFNFGFDDEDYWPNRADSGAGTFLKAVPEIQYVYRGFPAIVSYYLYTDEMVRSFNLEEEHDSPGYGKSTYEQPSMLNYENVRHNGKNYKRALIKRLSIIPNQEGTLEAPRLEGNARLYSFGYLNKNLSSTGGRIVVRQLNRDKAPQGFSGAVGNLKISHSISKTQLALGEALTFTLKIQGRGNFNQFTAPEFAAGKGFQVSIPMVSDNLNAGIDGTRIYYYTLIPQQKGELDLPPLSFTWFAHDKAEFNTWKLPSTKVKVTGAHVLSYLNRVLEPSVPRSMNPKLGTGKLRSYVPYVERAWYWVLLLLITAGIVLTVALAILKKARSRNPEKFARLSTERTLQRYMKQASAAARDLSLDFYPLAESSLWKFLDARYHLPNRLSTEEKINRLESFLAPDQLDKLRQFLANCTAARYMPAENVAYNISADLELLHQIVAAVQRGQKSASVKEKQP